MSPKAPKVLSLTEVAGLLEVTIFGHVEPPAVLVVLDPAGSLVVGEHCCRRLGTGAGCCGTDTGTDVG